MFDGLLSKESLVTNEYKGSGIRVFIGPEPGTKSS